MSFEDTHEQPTAHAKRLIAQAIADCPIKPSLREAILDLANLSGINISNFDLRFSQFRDCNLRGAQLPQVIPLEGEPDYCDALRDPSDHEIPGWEVINGRMVISLNQRSMPNSAKEIVEDYNRDQNEIDRDGSEWFSGDDE